MGFRLDGERVAVLQLLRPGVMQPRLPPVTNHETERVSKGVICAETPVMGAVGVFAGGGHSVLGILLGRSSGYPWQGQGRRTTSGSSTTMVTAAAMSSALVVSTPPSPPPPALDCAPSRVLSKHQ